MVQVEMINPVVAFYVGILQRVAQLLMEVKHLVKVPAVVFIFQRVADILVVLIGPEIIRIFLSPCEFVLGVSKIIQFKASNVFDANFVTSTHVCLQLDPEIAGISLLDAKAWQDLVPRDAAVAGVDLFRVL
jgi:hypothetical protein